MKTFVQILTEETLSADVITDFGKTITSDDGSYTLDRYGVWGQKPGEKKPGVIETGNDLNKLLKKYNLTKDKVVKI